jgi:hypothetical protein
MGGVSSWVSELSVSATLTLGTTEYQISSPPGHLIGQKQNRHVRKGAFASRRPLGRKSPDCEGCILADWCLRRLWAMEQFSECLRKSWDTEGGRR